jgi:hypothetical protein
MGKKGVIGSGFSIHRNGIQHALVRKGVWSMTENEKEMIERLADEAEVLLEGDYEKKDLKEKRAATKNSLFDGSKKLKHSIPKGKHLK